MGRVAHSQDRHGTQKDFVSNEKLHIKSSSPTKDFDVQTTEALLFGNVIIILYW